LVAPGYPRQHATKSARRGDATVWACPVHDPADRWSRVKLL
jgi:hypothetical protein